MLLIAVHNNRRRSKEHNNRCSTVTVLWTLLHRANTWTHGHMDTWTRGHMDRQVLSNNQLNPLETGSQIKGQLDFKLSTTSSDQS